MQKESSIKKILILLVFFIYCLYYIEDMKTSANVDVKQTDSRSGVYIFLIALIAILLMYIFFRARYFKDIGVNIPIICLVVWGMFVDIYNETNVWAMAVRLGLLVLWVATTFFISDIINDEKTYNILLALEFIIWIITMYYSAVAFSNFSDYKGDNTTNVLNISYNILVLIPLLLQLKNKYLKGFVLLVSGGFIFLSMKRGAILALILMLFTYCYTILKNKKINRKRFFITVLTVLSLIVVAFILVDRFTNHYLSSRFSIEELMDGSNRSKLYSAALQDIKNRSFWILMVGKGGGASVRELGTGVHNEILEMLFSYGLLGLIIYIWMIVKGVGSIIKQLKKKDEASAYYAMSMAYIVFVGLVGTALFAHYTFHIMVSIGLSCGYLRKTSKSLMEEQK